MRAFADPDANAAEIQALNAEIDALQRDELHEGMRTLGLRDVESTTPPPSDDGWQGPPNELDRRWARWAIPNVSFWHVLEQRVKNGKLATINGLSEQTRRSPRLKFVGRTRVGQFVDWIDTHPEQAERAWRLHEIPAGFRATGEGVLLPRPRNAASHHASS
jgi:hypothetical protein